MSYYVIISAGTCTHRHQRGLEHLSFLTEVVNYFSFNLQTSVLNTAETLDCLQRLQSVNTNKHRTIWKQLPIKWVPKSLAPEPQMKT